MKRIKLTQNSDEWHKWRSTGIGASDVPILLGLNPYKPRHKFLEEWLGLSPRKSVQNVDVHRGLRLESVAREKLSEEMAVTFRPLCVEWEEDNFLRASLDGYNEECNLICEIKAPRMIRSMSPAHYFQVQAQLLVTGARECVFCQIVERGTKPDIAWNMVGPDPQAFQQIQKALSRFKADVGVHTSAINEEELWKEYLKAKDSFANAELQYRMAESAVKATLGIEDETRFSTEDGRCFVLSREFRKGQVDYKSIPLLNEIDLEPYRKGPVETLSIREIKE